MVPPEAAHADRRSAGAGARGARVVAAWRRGQTRAGSALAARARSSGIASDRPRGAALVGLRLRRPGGELDEEPRHLLGGHGRADEMALHLVAAELAEHAELLLALDALGDDAE